MVLAKSYRATPAHMHSLFKTFVFRVILSAKAKERGRGHGCRKWPSRSNEKYTSSALVAWCGSYVYLCIWSCLRANKESDWSTRDFFFLFFFIYLYRNLYSGYSLDSPHWSDLLRWRGSYDNVLICIKSFDDYRFYLSKVLWCFL